MTFEQFSYFLAVAKHGSFSLAADELFISQSSLSKQIKALESDLGNVLINRKSYPITLTPAGKHFVKLAMGLTKDYKDMLFQMSQFADWVDSRALALWADDTNNPVPGGKSPDSPLAA